MTDENFYDISKWPIGDPHKDIGIVINSIIADIKKRQSESAVTGEGKPGATIFIPSGDYRLSTQILIDVSYLKILGTGHGFVSSSIRYNTPQSQWKDMHELWPGGSRILVDIAPSNIPDEKSGAAFLIERGGEPRISSVEFSNFCIDGLHFRADQIVPEDSENSYINGKTGIYIASAQDSFKFNEMGLVYLEHGLTIYNADALSIHDNFIAECGSCIELRGSGQASKITDNLIGAGFRGHSIYAQNFGGLLITTNNIFPRGASSIELDGVSRSSITSNRIHAFYPGVISLKNGCTENLVSSNHIYRSQEPWAPMRQYNNGHDDLYGILRIEGSDNSIIANHFSEIIDRDNIKPTGTIPIIIRLVTGQGNYVAANNVVARTESMQQVTDEGPASSSSTFSTQVEQLLTNSASEKIDVTTVLVEDSSSLNTILDSGNERQVTLDKSHNAFRPTPSL
ncbi:MAG: right-handed parallel beta-helix repeat-containing protein [Bifidobacteriaceae bacterium]|nr:right-handed parallel beta-helix repeat-containing protein [Bifidobacteriaceae bacterium]